MPQEMRVSRGRAMACRCLIAAVVAAWLGCLPSAILHAQSTTLKGYVTAVEPPDGFDINGVHVAITASTLFGPIDARHPASNGPMHDAVTMGAWVEVAGDFDPGTKTLTARSVFFRDDAESRQAGLGVILRVISTEPELVIAADGYRIRVTTATEIDYPNDMKSAADVHAGQWALYEGKLGQDGVLVAGKIRFLPEKHAKQRQGQAAPDSGPPSQTPQNPAHDDLAGEGNARPPDNIYCQTGLQRIAGDEITLTNENAKLFGNDTYRITRDQALQSRIRRIGMNLVPAYQKQLASDDPAKINFLFCAVDRPARDVIISAQLFDRGRILVPAKLAARFSNDDQLAAVLAEGVAYSLQQDAPIVVAVNRTNLVEAANIAVDSMALYRMLPGSSISNYQDTKGSYEERERVALELMADAGYDPWQAPEAWRLAAPGKLPSDTSTLKYPDQSGYQFAILNRMYKKPAPADAAAVGPTTSTSVSKRP